MNAERILDSLIGARSEPARDPNAANPNAANEPRGFLDDLLGAFGLNNEPGSNQPRGNLGHGVDDVRGTIGDWASQAKSAMGRNPGLTAGALAGMAGMLLTGRGRGLLGNVAGIGGIGLIGSLAYNAFRKYQARKAATQQPVPQALNPATATDQDAQIFARVMVAAIAADGHIDAVERARVTGGLRDAGLDREGAAWLDREFANPASVDEIARHAATPEKAAQIYSAARLAIEPDTAEERRFLERLATALRLDPALKMEIDGGAAGFKTA